MYTQTQGGIRRKTVALILSHLPEDKAFCHQRLQPNSTEVHEGGAVRTRCDYILIEHQLKIIIKTSCKLKVMAFYYSEISGPVSLESTVIE